MLILSNLTRHLSKSYHVNFIKYSISLCLQFLKRFVWLLDHYIIFIMFFGSEKVMSNPNFFFNVRNVKSTLVELKWQKLWQWSEKINLENLLLAFQVSFASKCPESLYETWTYGCCIRLCKIYKFDSFGDKICSTWNENVYEYWKQFWDSYNSLPVIYKWF